MDQRIILLLASGIIVLTACHGRCNLGHDISSVKPVGASTAAEIPIETSLYASHGPMLEVNGWYTGLVKYVWGEPSVIHLKEAEFVKPTGRPPDPIPKADEQWIYESVNHAYTRIIWFKDKHVVLAIEENKSDY